MNPEEDEEDERGNKGSTTNEYRHRAARSMIFQKCSMKKHVAASYVKTKENKTHFATDAMKRAAFAPSLR